MKTFRSTYSHVSLKGYPKNLTMIPEHLSALCNKCQMEVTPYFSPQENHGSLVFYRLGLISTFVRDQRMDTA